MFSKFKMLPSRFLLSLGMVLSFAAVALIAAPATPLTYAEGFDVSNDFDLLIRLVGPTYTQAGQNMTYELTIENSSSSTFTNIVFYNDLPADVSYVSGGEFIDNQTPQWVRFEIASLAAGASQTVSWVAQTSGSATVGNIITNDSFGFIETTPGAETGTYGPITTLVEAPGTLEAVYKDVNGTPFDVTVDGYQFQNYVNDPPRNFNDDLGAADMFMLMGPAVCDSGNTAETCVLSTAAKTWMQNKIKGMNGGHCEGMAATSLRLFNWDPFKQYSSPASFQSGAQTAIDLTFPKASLENYIAYYFITQSIDYDYYYDNEITTGPSISPKDLVDILIRDFNLAEPIPYTVGIFTQEFKAGHAIAAYGVEKVSNDEYRILVYDNNFPKQRQYITVKQESGAWGWRYTTAATPGEDALVYDGTETSENLSLHLNNSRDLPADQYYKCPFCPDETLARDVNSPYSVDADIHFEYTGEGAILVTNDEGQSTGDDPETDSFVNEIPDASVNHFKGGLGLEIPPQIIVPAQETDDTFYTIIVHGETITNTATGTLHITGPGFSIGVNDIELDPGELFEFTISPDGDHIAFDATEDLTAPEIYIAHDPVHPGDPSVIFDIEGVGLLAGERVVLELEPEAEQIYFSHTGPEEENFVVDMLLVWPDGDEEEYAETINVPAGSNSAFIDFGAWDGLLHPSTYIDGELQNPSVNHRLKLQNMSGSYSVTPQTNAPAGVYTVKATFTNVTEVSLEDVYFSVADLGMGNVVLNADGGAAGAGAIISVPDELLGADGILHTNESFTINFEVGLSEMDMSTLTIDANGTPHDWIHPDPPPAYDAQDSSFDFIVQATNTIFIPLVIN